MFLQTFILYHILTFVTRRYYNEVQFFNSYLKEKIRMQNIKLAPFRAVCPALIVTEPLVQEAVFFAVMVVQEILLLTRCCLLLSRLKVLRTEFQPKSKMESI